MHAGIKRVDIRPEMAELMHAFGFAPERSSDRLFPSGRLAPGARGHPTPRFSSQITHAFGKIPQLTQDDQNGQPSALSSSPPIWIPRAGLDLTGLAKLKAETEAMITDGHRDPVPSRPRSRPSIHWIGYRPSRMAGNEAFPTSRRLSPLPLVIQLGPQRSRGTPWRRLVAKWRPVPIPLSPIPSRS